MVGVAVNVTLVPEQMLVAEALTATEGVTVVLTVIVTGVEVAVVGVAHVAVDVMTQVTTSPLASAAFV
ncbi:hypothetical protein DSECCO2_618490 [anaerobic digester metagenome]